MRSANALSSNPMAWSETATGVSALVAAAAGLANLYLQAKDRVERLLIREGSAKPSIDHYTSFYVVNQGKQRVTLRDYGFLLYSGKLMSIPYRSEIAGPGDDIDLYEFKSLVLEPLEHVQTGMDVPGRVAGFYVQSTTSKRAIIRFAYDLPLRDRLVLAFRTMGRLEYA
jgi:hypothetical protein